MLLRALSKCLFNTDRFGASTTSPGSLFRGLTILWVKKCFLMSSLNLPWCSFELFPGILSLDPMEKSSAPPYLLPGSQEWESCMIPVAAILHKLFRRGSFPQGAALQEHTAPMSVPYGVASRVSKPAPA